MILALSMSCLEPWLIYPYLYLRVCLCKIRSHGRSKGILPQRWQARLAQCEPSVHENVCPYSEKMV